MKKAQVLSAIALAFALGIVAPVAGVHAYKITDNTNGLVGEATCGDLTNAIKAVRATGAYKNAKAYADAIEAYNDLPAATKAKIVTMNQGVANTMITNLGTKFDAINTALSALKNAGVANANISNVALTTVVEANAATPANITIKNLTDALAAAEKTPKLSNWRQWIKDLSSASLATRAAAARAINTAYNFGEDTTTDTAADALASILNGATTPTTGSKKAAEKALYDAYDALITEIDEDNDDWFLSDYVTQVNALSAALTTLYNAKQMTAVGENNYRTLVRDVKFPALASLIDFNNNDIKHYDDWATVRGNIDDLENKSLYCGDYNTDNKKNFDGLIVLATNYGAALDSTMYVGDVAQRLANYTGTGSQQTDPSADIVPGVDAPASGVLGSAEGSATTISIVAGLATALTALGAGVVAYRNARREK